MRCPRPALAALVAVTLGLGCGPRTPAPAPTAGPCDDFYHHVNAAWIAANPIPDDQVRWSLRLEMRERTAVRLRELLDALRTQPQPAGSPEAKLGTLYGSCLDEAGAERAGAAPLAAELARIDAITTPDALARELARLHLDGTPAAFTLAAAQDRDRPDQVIAEISPSGALGLPSRADYLDATPEARELRDAYAAHVARLLALTGIDAGAATAAAARVVALETALATAILTVTEQQDPAALVHPTTLAELTALTPHWPWPVYLAELGRPDLAAANVTEPRYLAALDAALASTPLADWRHYLRWRVAAAAAPYLGRAFADADLAFAARLGGATAAPPRWRQCVALVDELMGEALGRVYVATALPPEAKAAATEMAATIIATLRDELSTLAWMSPATRREAVAKLDAFRLELGYPSAWRDYGGLAVTPGALWTNVAAARRFEAARQLAKIGRPADRTEWLQTPATVDGYFDPRLNRASIAAGLLQPPYFDAAGDLAANYGAMGAMIGHELVHGFDAIGRQFDAAGALRDWWAPDDAREFERRARLIVAQYDRYAVPDGDRVNGEQTLSENLADIAGVRIAFAAFQRALRGRPLDARDGRSPEQRFFLAYAASWRSSFRPEYMRTFLRTNTHAPPQFRINGPLANFPAFAAAFGCPADSPMVAAPADRADLF
jgi:endothelin-converting enzyme/putative endopeptidase